MKTCAGLLFFQQRKCIGTQKGNWPDKQNQWCHWDRYNLKCINSHPSLKLVWVTVMLSHFGNGWSQGNKKNAPKKKLKKFPLELIKIQHSSNTLLPPPPLLLLSPPSFFPHPPPLSSICSNSYRLASLPPLHASLDRPWSFWWIHKKDLLHSWLRWSGGEKNKSDGEKTKKKKKKKKKKAISTSRGRGDDVNVFGSDGMQK